MPRLYLFRLKAIKTAQGALFESGTSRDEFLTSVIESKPSEELREGYVWHVGNVLSVGKDGLLFAAGRTTKKSKELYDEETGDFIQVDDEESPFTYVYFDKKYSVLAIEPKSKLSPTAKGIANSLEKLFNQQASVHDYGAKIEISEIWDPEDFLKQIRSAYSVVGFTVEFTKPNPFDVEADFHKPMEQYIEATGGQKGKTIVQGEDLDRNSIEKVTRSVASTGNDASARIRHEEGQRPVTRHLRGDPVSVAFDEEERQEPKGLMERVREAYARIRRQDRK